MLCEHVCTCPTVLLVPSLCVGADVGVNLCQSVPGTLPGYSFWNEMERSTVLAALGPTAR